MDNCQGHERWDPLTARMMEPPDLTQVLPLVQPLLTPPELLALFLSNKGVGELVVCNAECTHLRVRAAKAALPTTMLTSMRPRSVALTLQEGLAPPAPLQPTITSLTLEGGVASPPVGQHELQLQLRQLPRLHSLGLIGWHFAGTRQQQAVVPTHPHPLVRTLECVSCTPAPSALATALHLVDPTQLQCLTTDSAALPQHLPQLPALRRVCLQREANSATLLALLQHAPVKEVIISIPAALQLSKNHSFAQCDWDLLELHPGIRISTLSRLPLWHVKCCKVIGAMTLSHETESWVGTCATLATHCAKLVCEPAPDDRIPAQFARAAFQIQWLGPRLARSPELSRLVRACMKHLKGAMVLCYFKITPELLAVLAACPPSVTMLGFMGCELRCGRNVAPPPVGQGGAAIWGQGVAHVVGQGAAAIGAQGGAPIGGQDAAALGVQGAGAPVGQGGVEIIVHNGAPVGQGGAQIVVHDGAPEGQDGAHVGQAGAPLEPGGVHNGAPVMGQGGVHVVVHNGAPMGQGGAAPILLPAGGHIVVQNGVAVVHHHGAAPIMGLQGGAAMAYSDLPRHLPAHVTRVAFWGHGLVYVFNRRPRCSGGGDEWQEVIAIP